jgi:hypothetical protein
LVRQEKERLHHEKEIISAQYDRIITFLREHGAMKGQPQEKSETEKEEKTEDESEKEEKTEDSEVENEIKDEIKGDEN